VSFARAGYGERPVAVDATEPMQVRSTGVARDGRPRPRRRALAGLCEASGDVDDADPAVAVDVDPCRVLGRDLPEASDAATSRTLNLPSLVTSSHWPSPSGSLAIPSPVTSTLQSVGAVRFTSESSTTHPESRSGEPATVRVPSPIRAIANRTGTCSEVIKSHPLDPEDRSSTAPSVRWLSRREI